MSAADPSDQSKINIVTMGPSCWDTDMLVNLIDEGMTVARLNTTATLVRPATVARLAAESISAH